MKQATIMVKQDDGSFKEVGISLRPNSTISADKNGELQSGQGKAAIPQGDNSHAEGLNTLATGIAAHAEGGGPDNGAASSSGPSGDFAGLIFSGPDAEANEYAGTYLPNAGEFSNGKQVYRRDAIRAIYWSPDQNAWQLPYPGDNVLCYNSEGTGDAEHPVAMASGEETWHRQSDGMAPAITVAYALTELSGSGSGGTGLGSLAEGDYSHTQNKETHAGAEASSASGWQSHARQFGEHAFASGMFAERGDAQVSHFILKGEAYQVQKLGDGSEIQIPAGYGFYLDAMCISGDASPDVVGGRTAAFGYFMEPSVRSITPAESFETFAPSLSDAGVLSLPVLNRRSVTYARLLLMKLTA